MSAKFILAVLSLTGWLIVAAIPAQACDVRLGALNIAPVDYDPFKFAPVATQAKVSLDLTGGDTCSVTLRLTNDSLMRLDTIAVGGPTPALFAIRPAQTGAQVDSTGETITVTLSHDNPHAEADWDLVLRQDAVLAPNTYTIPLTVAARADGSAADLLVKGAFTLRTLPRAQINIAGASGAFGQSPLALIDFGTLETGEQRRAFVQIRANSPVTVQVSSKNHGVMTNETLPGADPINYSLSLGGKTLNLSGMAQVPVDPPRTVDGVSLPMDITIGNVDGKMAGRYSDVIIIDVSS